MSIRTLRPIGPAQLLQPLQERRDAGLTFRIVRGAGHEHADAPHPLALLRARRERPRRRRAAEQRDELAPLHSITSSARASSVGGTARPSILAVWALMTSSNLRRLHDRQVRRLGALEDAAGIDADLTIRIRNVGSVAHQPAGFGKFTRRICRGDRVARRQSGQLDTPAGEEGVAADEERVGPLAHKSCEGRIDLAAGAGVEDLDLQPHGAGSRFHVSQRGLGIRSIGRIDEHGHTSGSRAPAHAGVPAALPPTQP